MSYQQQLQPASFRGVPFKVADIDTLFGRRNQLHEFPFRDIPYAKDFGKKAREYTIHAHIIGSNYLQARNDLMAAIEDHETPGTLIHPTLGALTVVPTDCRVLYDNKQGGLETFMFTFVEAGQQEYPQALMDTPSNVLQKVEKAIDDAVKVFYEWHQTANQPYFLVEETKRLKTKLINEVYVATKLGLSNTSSYSQFDEELTAFGENTSLNDIGNEVSNIMTQVSTLYDEPEDAYSAQEQLTHFGEDECEITCNTPMRCQQATNQRAFTDLVRYHAAIELARTASQMNFASRPEAINIRDEISDILDLFMQEAADQSLDTSYQALLDVRSSLVKDINHRAAQLPTLETITLPESQPAVMLAYELYEDATCSEEIVSRNNIRHPLFLPPHTELEVLR